jgi:hypothetical protein
MAKEFEAKTPKGQKLPQHVGEGSSEQETSSDRKNDSPAVKKREYGKKKHTKAQQDAMARRLAGKGGGKGSGRH